MRRKKSRTKYLVVLGLVLCVSIGYAYLSSSLNITGLGHLNRSVWSIYFYDLKVTKGESLVTTAPTINGNKTTSLEYSVNFTKPGDVYQFNVDVVNDGTMDAMISLINKTELTDDQKKFADFTITYADGSLLQEKNFLGSKMSDSFTVTVSYRKDINVEDLPTTEASLNFELGLEYTQAKDSDNRKNKSLVIKDLSENGNDAILIGGKKNNDNTITLDGVNDYMNCGFDNYDFGNALSYVLRTKINQGSRISYLMGNWQQAGMGIDLQENNTFRASVFSRANNYTRFMTTPVRSENTWYTLVLTYDGAKVKLYVNGAAQTSTETSTTEMDNTDAVLSSSLPIYVGANPEPDGIITQPSAITVSDVLIFNRALTAEEINDNYKSTVNPVDTTNMLAYYNFE